MLICGIDPGLGGAIAFLNTKGGIETLPMPVFRLTRGAKAKSEIDAHELARLFWERHADHVFIEQVGAMPGQGVTSMFAFGKGYGVVLGILAAVAVPMTVVSSMKWKQTLGVGRSKDGSRARASQLWPEIAAQWSKAKDEGRAEAALIAYYGYQTQMMRDARHGEEVPAVRAILPDGYLAR